MFDPLWHFRAVKKIYRSPHYHCFMPEISHNVTKIHQIVNSLWFYAFVCLCYEENVFLWSRCDVNNGWHCEVEQMNCHQLCWLLEWKRAFLLFAFTQDTKPVSEMQKKNMHAIKTHNSAKVRAQEDRKAAIVLDYNINKAGGDNLDKVTGTYSSNRTASGLSWYATISMPYQPPLTYKGY